MLQARLTLKLLSVCIVSALGPMALIATGAQATAEWKIKGTTLKTTESFKGFAEAPFVFEMQLGGKPPHSMQIKCNTLGFDSGTLFGSSEGVNAGTGSGTALLTECKAFIDLTEAPGCSPKEPMSLGVRLLQVLIEAKTHWEFEPLSAGSFGIVHLNEACVLGSEFSVTGGILFECLKTPCETESSQHIISTTGNSMKFGKYPMTLSGSINLKLNGEHSAEEWSGIV
jgi:hypothetical protein